MGALPPSPSAPVSDAALMQRLAQRDSRALIEFERRHGASLYALVYAIVMDPPRAERVVSRVFEHLWDTSIAFDSQRRSPWSWLRNAARELAYADVAGKHDNSLRGGISR